MKVPVYNYSLAEARELEEEEKWLESHKANVECKEGIEKAIRPLRKIRCPSAFAKNCCK